MKLKITILAAVVASLALSGPVLSASEAEKRAAIDAGLAYLATTQNGTEGYFGSGGLDYRLAQTGSALLAFLEEKPNWGANAAAYQSVVDRGLDYLMNNAAIAPISSQPHGDPDGDGNGVGVEFYLGGAQSRDTYVTGMVVPAIASSGTPDKLVSTGPLVGRTDGTGPGGAWTYKDVVQNAVDYFAFGQNEGGPGSGTTARGGWRYYANSGPSQGSDQSTTQWPVITALFANKMGVSMPDFVKDELAIWTDYIQNPATGAAGYDRPTAPYGEMNETGALLLMQDYVGLPTSDSRVQAALAYIDTHWQQPPSSFDGNIGNPYAMWAIYKGLEVTVGLDADTSLIGNLLNPTCGGNVDNPDHGCNWYEDYAEWLVTNQNANGSWTGYSYWGTGLATPWFINILAATEIPDDDDDEPIPLPSTLALLAAGLLGVRRQLRHGCRRA
jgi:hypothetical protein